MTPLFAADDAAHASFLPVLSAAVVSSTFIFHDNIHWYPTAFGFFAFGMLLRHNGF